MRTSRPATDPPGPAARLHLRVLLGPAVAMGPGKADFLAAVSEVGSIVDAGRALGLSYKKTRTLVDELNSTSCGPVVATTKGGRGFGGSALDPARGGGTGALSLDRATRRQDGSGGPRRPGCPGSGTRAASAG